MESRFEQRGTHEGCGACCSRWLPLTADDRARLEAHVAAEGLRRPPKRAADDAFVCPFLDADGRCSIYAIRPAICAAFSCDDEAMQETFRFTGRGDEMTFNGIVATLTDMREFAAQ